MQVTKSSRNRQRMALPSPGRLLQIDYWRGLCLLLILVHHLPLSFSGRFTLSSIGFCDAVAVFVFLSGFVCRLAFGSVLEKQGWMALGVKVFRRAGLLLGAHLVMTICAVAAIVLFHRFWPGESMLDFDLLSETTVLAHPVREVVLAARLQQHVWLCHVLPLYFIFIVLLPIFFALMKISPWLLLMSSGLLWASVRLSVSFSVGGFLHDSGFWLNPYAWQFLFVLGFVFADAARKGKLGVMRAPFFYAGVAMVLGIAAVKLRLFPGAHYFSPLLQTKVMADFSYVAYFGLLALVMASLVSNPHTLSRWPGVPFVSAVGRNSLAVWVASAVIVYAAFFLRRVMVAPWWVEDLVILAAALAPIWLTISRHSRGPVDLANARQVATAG